jgi:ABC-type uncharacterized transport system permease subunit
LKYHRPLRLLHCVIRFVWSTIGRFVCYTVSSVSFEVPSAASFVTLCHPFRLKYHRSLRLLHCVIRFVWSTIGRFVCYTVSSVSFVTHWWRVLWKKWWCCLPYVVGALFSACMFVGRLL